MTQANGDLVSRLNQGPAVLFLGQSHLQIGSGRDPFLADLISKYGPRREDVDNYSQLLRGEAQNSPEVAISWMHERSERLAIPRWLQIVGSYSWSNVYTSAIDTVWYRSFRVDWREPQPIFESKYKPANPRNRYKLHCTFLFGCVNQTEGAGRPPLKKLEWLERKQEAIALALRLPEIITPFGVLIIEGYEGLKDWFGLDDMLPILNKLNPGQAHIFGATDADSWGADYSGLVQTGKVTPHVETLASYLMQADEDGLLQLGPRPEDFGQGLRVKVGDRPLFVPLDLWRQVSRSLTILDDSMFQPKAPVSPDQRYLDFRNFLALSSNKPVWSGYASDFAFERDFEKRLLAEVTRALDARLLPENPIILHGQSGIGKTVALGRLAFEIRKAKKCPVIYIERKSQRPQVADIDAFCKWFEDNGASSTLLIWDGMADVETYTDLLRYLAGRGRKVVLVGTCYRLEGTLSRNRGFLEVPSQLSEEEILRLVSFLNNLYPNLGSLVSWRTRPGDSSFLVALYRLLPETRQGLTASLSREATAAEKEIQVRSTETEPIATTALAYALLKAGLVRKEELFCPTPRDVGGEPVTELQELIGLVMVPGQFGLMVPLELLMRTVHKGWLSNFVDLVSGIDLFRWYEDAVGNYTIGPRHPLEAEIIARARLGDSRAEVAYIERLLAEIKSETLTDNTEVNFAVDLLQRIGPNGRYRTRFAPHYPKLSERLKWLRESRGIQHPRLMLQEANLLREYVLWQSETGASEVDPTSLGRAQEILQKALDLLRDEHRDMMLRGVILVELGTALASKTRQSLEQHEGVDTSLRLFQDAREQLFQAISANPEDFHPLDVLFWITVDVIKARILTPRSEAEAKADLLNFFSLVDPESLDLEQRKRYNEKRWQLGQMIGRESMSDDAFKELLKLGSKAGYYLRTAAMTGIIAGDKELSCMETQRCASAAQYLQNHREDIRGDSRCLYALLKYWWMSRTAKPIFFEERQTTAFSYEDWSFVSGLLADLKAAEGVYFKPQIDYLRGIAEFHLASISGALAIFRDLEREVDYMRGRRRIIRSYLASSPDGKPRVFNGTVAWIHKDGTKGEVYVEEILTRIPFLPNEFARGDELHPNDALGKFHIAFNFLGPIADPFAYLRASQSKTR